MFSVDAFIAALSALNIISAFLLSIYALHQGVLFVLFLRSHLSRSRSPCASESRQSQPDQSLNASISDGRWPCVTVQAPLYNEQFVAQRLIEALCRLDYPAELLQIQVLDDSTDDTARIAQAAVEAGRAAGVPIELIHRDHRAGFKSGALAHALPLARGEFIVLFDADFIPPPDFLRRVLAPGGPFDDPEVGFVQTRWGYLDRDTAPLKRAQALLLDMHFGVDQPARSSWRLPMNFNGSAGVWRRACIDAVGGWQSDTLTEDLDLSYRAQLAGWRGVYRLDLVSPGELPASVISFKRQQARWARGTAQCLRKLAGRVMRSSWSPARKLAGLMHLSGYMTYPLLFLLAVTAPLLAMNAHGQPIMPSWMSLIGLPGLLPMLSMFIAHCQQGRPVRHFARDLPAAVLLGIGLAWSNTLATVLGLLSPASGVFVRTPKLVAVQNAQRAVEGSSSHLTARHPILDEYTEAPDWTVIVEAGLALYVLGVCLMLARLGEWLAMLPLVLYGLSFSAIVLGQLVSVVKGRRRFTTSTLSTLSLFSPSLQSPSHKSASSSSQMRSAD
ncbi:MAG: glycosyltransferase [Anaerolineae bacterium]|nr:glycosyltransferase [Thermoflexales bacterium]MDW8407391.1 glycosyltransferase [Anaerolineae bacterium]